MNPNNEHRTVSALDLAETLQELQELEALVRTGEATSAKRLRFVALKHHLQALRKENQK